MGGVPGSRVEPSCLGPATINDETGAGIGDDAVDATVVGNIVVEAPTTGDTLGGKILKSIKMLNNNP